MALVDRVLRALDRVAAASAYAGGMLLAGIALFMAADVALRYLFNRPIFGAQDLIELALVVIVFSAVAYCGRAEGHVAVDLFFTRMSSQARRRADLAMKLLAASVLALLTWRSGARALSFDAGDATNLLQVPRWPFYGAIAVGSALYAVVLLAEIAFMLRDRRMQSGQQA
jgi:TRAP-type C4-dicarboxylate transport system permease small subunit